LTLLAAGVVGSVVGIGIHLWLEPWTSIVALAAGSIAGLLLSHALGQDVLLGLGIGSAIALAIIGVRACVSIWTTLWRPPSVASPRVWFAR